MAHHRSGVDLRDHRDVKPFEVFLRHLLGTPVGADGRKLAGHQAFNVGAAGFVVGGIGAVISDLRIGEDDYLSSVGRIGEDFLVACQGGIENHFAETFSFGAIALTAEDAPVFEREDCLHGFSVEWIQSSLTGINGELVDDSHVFGRPVNKGRFAVDQVARDWSEIAAVAGNGAMIAHHKILLRGNDHCIL